MTAVATDTRSSVQNALAWAQRAFMFADSDLVADHPWAKTFRLRGEDRDAYLKIVPFAAARRVRLLAGIAKSFPEITPAMLAAHASAGYVLYADHGGSALDRNPDHDTRRHLLSDYAAIQGAAAALPSLRRTLPAHRAEDQIGRLLAFLSGGGTGTPLDAHAFLGAASAGRYFGVFEAVQDIFREFLTIADGLPPTLNHCDLRPANVARRHDGSLVIFDWDDAVWGPPGMSLHNFFSGCVRPWQALAAQGDDRDDQDETVGQDRALLSAYAEVLGAHKSWRADTLMAALPAAICAGAIHYVVGFGEFPVRSERLRKTIGKNIRRRLSSLMDLSALLVRDKPAARAGLAAAFVKAGRRERAEALRGTGAQVLPAGRPDGKAPVRRDAGEFPAIAISGEERKQGVLDRETRKRGAALFDKHGALLIRNALPVSAVEQCHEAFYEKYRKYLVEAKHADALRVGNKRYMITVEVAPPFSDPEILTSPMFMPIVRDFLGKDMILGSLTCVASLPGSADQRLHKDHKALFRDRPDIQVPSFAISVVVPLIDLDEETGGTRVISGSHRKNREEAKRMPGQTADMPLGSCFLMDYRLSHHGLANRSQKVRPILCIIFHRPWFRDYVNFGKQDPLVIPPDAKRGFTKEIRQLTAWSPQG